MSLRSKPLEISQCPVSSEAPDAAGSARVRPRPVLYQSLRSKPLEISQCPVSSEAPDAAGSASELASQASFDCVARLHQHQNLSSSRVRIRFSYSRHPTFRTLPLWRIGGICNNHP